MLKFYNTLARKKQAFEPQDKSETKMYTCGLTVYDYAHVGNLRSFLFEDLLRRVLEFNDFRVIHVQNFTDVGHLVSDEDTGEDKMQVGAQRERKTAWDIASFYIHAFKEDADLLRMRSPTHWPRATDNIKEMIDLVKTLEEKGFTYVIEDGVYFDTSKLKDYGKLARLKKEGLKAGARVEMGGKRNPTDFALWKLSPKDSRRDMEWDSPWGTGFPGWHIECSVMAMKYLGETLDIHCGGVDHITVHHTNEIAQSEAATGKPFSRFWLHNEFMLVDGKKMSKSLGNFYRLKDLMDKGFSPLAFRYLCFSVHYRSQMNFTLDALRDAKNTLDTINDFLHRVRSAEPGKKENAGLMSLIGKAEKEFLECLNDDLNTPGALAALFDMIKAVNREMESGKADRDSLHRIEKFLHDFNKIFDVLDLEEKELTQEEKKLVVLREKFRKEKDYKAADEIRNQLKEKGVVVEDTPQGARWRKI